VKDKQQQGPATVDELAVLYAKGKAGGGINNETLVWCAAMDEWTRLKELSTLVQLVQRPVSAAGPPQQAEQHHTSAPVPVPAAAPKPCAPSKGAYGSVPSSSKAPPMGLGPRDAVAASTASVNSAAIRTGGGGNSMKKHSNIREFLLGWLPFRAPPKDLVRRGILHAEPGGTAQAGAAVDEVFGCHLATALRRPDTVNGIPSVVSVLMDLLRRNGAEGLRSEGIFRVPGDQTEMRGLRQLLNQGGDTEQVLSNCQNLHSIAGLLKMYFRELRPPLLTFELYDDFIQCSADLGAPSAVGDVSALRDLLSRLPEGHGPLLRHLIEFLAEVVGHGGESRMTAGNTAAVFAPNLLRPELETLEHLADTAHIVNLITTLILNHRRVFGSEMSSRASFEAAVPRSASTDQAIYLSTQPSRSGHASDSQPALMSSGSQGCAAAAGEGSEPSEVEPRSWYYLSQDHQQQGPVDWPQLQTLFSGMHIDGDTYVFTEGLSDWTLVSTLDMHGQEPTVS